MLATGRYSQWRSRFLRYIDTRPNGESLRKCIIEGPYTLTTIVVPPVHATENSPAVPEQTTVETVMNMTLENRAHFELEKEAIQLILTGIGDEIYSTVDACQTISRNVGKPSKGYRQGESLTIPNVRKKLFDEVSYHKLFDILKQYQKEVNELRAERMAKNANPLALVASAQTLQDTYYQSSKPHKSYAPTSKASLPTRSHATTRHKGKEIAKPITPPSESASEEDSDPEQAQRDKDMQKNLALIAKYFKKIYKPTNNNLRTSSNTKNKNVDTTLIEFGHYAKECRKPKRVKDSTYHKEKMLLCKQAEKGVQLQAEQSDWLADTDEEIDEQEWSTITFTCQRTRSKSRQAYNVMTNNINHLKEIVDQAWVKHSNDRLHLRNPTAQDMEILVKTCLMPFAFKTQNDSFAFVYELKQEMHADLKYVESLEDEIDELEFDKAKFSNMYDMLLQECVSKDVIFTKLEKHLISLEIALQQCLEQLKNDTVCKEKALNVFRKEREQYFEIQDLKAQLQDKNIAISELKKLIEKCKGKSVDTKFDKPSVVRQPNAQRIPKPLVLGKPAPFSDSLERTNFAKKKSVSKTNESEGLSKPVTPHNLPQTATQAVRNTNVIKPGMYRIASSTTHHLAVRHSVDYSSSDHFSSDDSSRDSSSSSSSSSSSKTSSDSSADALSDPVSSRSSSDQSLPAPSSGMRPYHHYVHCPSHKRSRSSAASVPLSSPISEALSYAHADLLPSPKRIRSLKSTTDIEVSSTEGSEPSRYRGIKVEMDDDVVRSDGIDIDPEIQAEINECIAYADALRDKGIDAKAVVEVVDREEIDIGARGLVEEERVVEVTYETLGDLVQRFHDHTKEIPVHRVQAIESLDQDNRRLRDMIDVASQRVTRSQRKELRVQREMRQI
ncbi:hypothetical protein Tco_0912420 [Tanacetum coccineum]